MNAIHRVSAMGSAGMTNATCGGPLLPASPPLSDELQQLTLRRTGRKPVRFSGRHVLEALGTPLQEGMWYDLNMYRTEAGAIIVELISRRSYFRECDLYRVEVFVKIDDAACWLQSYSCVNDIPVPPGITGGEVPLAHAAVQAVRLRQHIARLEDEYHALLCDVFTTLGLADGAEDMLEAELTDAACA
jgi:hypothetical protein